MIYSPWEYQERGIKFMLERACAGLFASPGTGKTSMLLSAMSILLQKKIVKKVLIVAPLRVAHAVWPAEVQKWDNFNHLSTVVLHGKDKDKLLLEEHDIYIINFEGLKWLEQSTRYQAFPFDVLVIDESSKVKSVSTQRFKILKKMLDKFKRRYILTGSPTPNSLLDIFGQVYIMDAGATFGPYITKFRNDYFRQTGFGGYEWVLQPGADLKIHAKLAPHVMRFDAKDYLQMPPITYNSIKVQLPPEAMVKYMAMENKLKLDVAEGKVTAANSAVAAGYCHQIANGALYIDPSTGAYEEIHSAKLDAVQDLVEELEGQPCLIAYSFKHDLERLKKLFGKDTPSIGGGVSAKRSTEIIEAWNRKEIPVLLAQVAALSHGINAQQGGSTVIWFSLDYSQESYEQFNARLWRQGQENHVFIHRIVAENTIDEAIIKALERKEKGQNSLLNALKEYWNK